jgi:hypothetical protein
MIESYLCKKAWKRIESLRVLLSWFHTFIIDSDENHRQCDTDYSIGVEN